MRQKWTLLITDIMYLYVFMYSYITWKDITFNKEEYIGSMQVSPKDTCYHAI